MVSLVCTGLLLLTHDEDWLKKVNTHNLMDLLPTKEKINRQHRRRFADIETITIYRNFDIFLDDIDTIRYGQYRLDISFGRYIVASLIWIYFVLFLHDALLWHGMHKVLCFFLDVPLLPVYKLLASKMFDFCGHCLWTNILAHDHHAFFLNIVDCCVPSGEL